MKQRTVIEFLERLEREADCFLPQNFVISDIDYRIPQEGEVRVLISVQRVRRKDLTFTIDVSGESADEMMRRFRGATSTLC